MNVLVTGANGFIGARVCCGLLERGHRVVALCHLGRERLLGLAAEKRLQVETGDILDVDGLDAIATEREPDAICHLAVQPPGAEPELTRRVNVQGTENLLDLCRRRGIERMVFASSMSVYDFLAPDYLPVDEEHPTAPLQPYGEEKLEGERLCRRYAEGGGLHLPILRFSGVYGPGKRAGAVFNFARAVVRGGPVVIGQDRRIDLLCVEDAARCAAIALERADGIGCGIFNVGAGVSIALSELAATIGRLTRREACVECRGEGNEFYLDISRARSALDFTPTAIEEGLRPCIRRVEEELKYGG